MDSQKGNTVLTSKIDEYYKKNNCSYMSCMTCKYGKCYTGRIARKHGKKGYDAISKILNNK